jgi:hypothetical protein
MATSVPIFGSGIYVAVTGSGTLSDPYVPALSSSGSPVASFPLPGTGAYFAAASGAGTASNPYVLLVDSKEDEFSADFSADFR